MKYAKQTQQIFGDANSSIPFALNSVFDIDTMDGSGSIAFYLTVPAGGKVGFQGSFDGINFDTVQLKGSSGFVTETTTSGNFQGAIANYRKIRLRMLAAGTSNGSVIGTLSPQLPANVTLPAGNINVPYVALKDQLQYCSTNAITTNAAVQVFAAPASGLRNYVTWYAVVNASNSAATMEIRDGNTIIFRDVVPANSKSSMSFVTPLKGSTGNALSVVFSTTILSSLSNYVTFSGFQA